MKIIFDTIDDNAMSSVIPALKKDEIDVHGNRMGIYLTTADNIRFGC